MVNNNEQLSTKEDLSTISAKTIDSKILLKNKETLFWKYKTTYNEQETIAKIKRKWNNMNIYKTKTWWTIHFNGKKYNLINKIPTEGVPIKEIITEDFFIKRIMEITKTNKKAKDYDDFEETLEDIYETLFEEWFREWVGKYFDETIEYRTEDEKDKKNTNKKNNKKKTKKENTDYSIGYNGNEVTQKKTKINHKQPYNIYEKMTETDIIKDKNDFINYLDQTNLRGYDRRTHLWRYVRVMRYDHILKYYGQKYKVPKKSLFILTMVESQWNAISFNPKDWWAGLMHTQPDVAQRLGMKIFTDKVTKYKEYNYKEYYAKLLAQNKKNKVKNPKRKAHRAVYKKHWELIQKFADNNNHEFGKLSEADDRFYPGKNIEVSTKYLRRIYDNYVNKWSKKNSPESEKRFYTLNWFNKWPKNYTNEFTANVSHVNHLRNSLKYYNKYEKIVNDNINKWLTGSQILTKLKATK